MSRRTTMEYVGTQRRAYSQLKSKSKKTAFIDSMCQAFGFERKYATKLLTGNRKYKEPKGRGIFGDCPHLHPWELYKSTGTGEPEHGRLLIHVPILLLTFGKGSQVKI